MDQTFASYVCSGPWSFLKKDHISIMASVKIATLLVRTIAKPISTGLKNQAKQHETFRQFCVNLAQGLYRSEVKLRTHVMGEPARHIRPLSETRAIENGANFIAEGFLFTVAAGLILGETWRTSRNQSKRRDDVDDQLDSLGTKVLELTTRVDTLVDQWEKDLSEERKTNAELSRILQRIVEIGMRGGWAEFEGTPLQIPRIQLAPHHLPASDENLPKTIDVNTDTTDTNIHPSPDPPDSKSESSSSSSSSSSSY